MDPIRKARKYLEWIIKKAYNQNMLIYHQNMIIYQKSTDAAEEVLRESCIPLNA